MRYIMKKKIKLSIDEIIAEIKITEQRMKKAKLTNDKVGYEIALKRHEELYSKYGHILYRKRKPTQVFENRW